MLTSSQNVPDLPKATNAETLTGAGIVSLIGLPVSRRSEDALITGEAKRETASMVPASFLAGRTTETVFSAKLEACAGRAMEKTEKQSGVSSGAHDRPWKTVKIHR
jgi:hypothetical protein